MAEAYKLMAPHGRDDLLLKVERGDPLSPARWIGGKPNKESFVMLIGARIAMFVLVGLLFVAPAQAALLFPLQTRQWMETDKQDQAGHKWTVRGDVLGEVTLNNKKYSHVLQQNYDPVEGDTFDHNLVRSTDTELFVVFNGEGAEQLMFKLGPVGTNWIWGAPGGTNVLKEIVAIEEINIPCGGTYTAYKYRQHSINSSGGYHYEWVVPGLGWIAKEEDYWVSEGRATPINSVLARMDKNPAPWTGNYTFVDIDYPRGAKPPHLMTSEASTTWARLSAHTPWEGGNTPLSKTGILIAPSAAFRAPTV